MSASFGVSCGVGRNARRRPCPATPTPTRALTRADEACHAQLDAVLRQVAELQQGIAEADLNTETLRCALVDFTRRYEATLAEERRALLRVQLLLGHINRWLHLLDDAAWSPRPSCGRLRALHQRREQEVKSWQQEVAHNAPTATAAAPAPPASHGAKAPAGAAAAAAAQPSWHARRKDDAQRLKRAYRALARRFHPDMASDEGERTRRSRLMVHINALYDQGERQHLEALAEQAENHVAIDAAAERQVPVQARLQQACARRDWLEAVRKSLEEEAQALENSPTATLWHALEGGPRGHSFRPEVLRELRADLNSETRARLQDVPVAIRAMEQAVERRNHVEQQNGATAAVLARARSQAPVRQQRFDAGAAQQLARLGVDDLKRRQLSPRVAEWARRLEARAEREPGAVRLILLTYVVQLAPGGMPGLDSFAQLNARFAACGRTERHPTSLAQALLQADGAVEYTPDRAANGGLACSLRFRDAALAEGIPQALRGFAVRRIFAELLRHLGEERHCEAAACRRRVFCLPLFLLRGLDHVRALVCPRCGSVLTSYVLARGDDVQGVLGTAYLDFGLIEEFTVAFAQASVGLQLLPEQRSQYAVRHLIERLRQHLFARNALDVPAHHLRLAQDGRALRPSTRLSSLPHHQLTLCVEGDAAMDEAELLTTLRYRLQVRFAGPKRPQC